MTERTNDLVERTFRYAQAVRKLVNKLPRILANYEDARQVVRSSGSVAANYVESQEGLSRKDFFFRIKVCRKEARETPLWLRLLELENDPVSTKDRDILVKESEELIRIFSTIASKDDTT